MKNDRQVFFKIVIIFIGIMIFISSGKIQAKIQEHDIIKNVEELKILEKKRIEESIKDLEEAAKYLKDVKSWWFKSRDAARNLGVIGDVSTIPILTNILNNTTHSQLREFIEDALKKIENASTQDDGRKNKILNGFLADDEKTGHIFLYEDDLRDSTDRSHTHYIIYGKIGDDLRKLLSTNNLVRISAKAFVTVVQVVESDEALTNVYNIVIREIHNIEFIHKNIVELIRTIKGYMYSSCMNHHYIMSEIKDGRMSNEDLDNCEHSINEKCLLLLKQLKETKNLTSQVEQEKIKLIKKIDEDIEIGKWFQEQEQIEAEKNLNLWIK